jgi:hypothetical protein
MTMRAATSRASVRTGNAAYTRGGASSGHDARLGRPNDAADQATPSTIRALLSCRVPAARIHSR